MPFRPNMHDTLTLNGMVYHFTEHPSAPGMPYGQTGEHSTVYQLAAGEERYALKVFNVGMRSPRIVEDARRLRAFQFLPGLHVCTRTVITPEAHAQVTTRYPDLTYAILMPWIAGEVWQHIVVDRQVLTPEHGLLLAQSLAHILGTMEQHAMAHCDLSGVNIVVTRQQDQAFVQLLDLDSLYAPGMNSPHVRPEKSPGYAHVQTPAGVWVPEADRFAGAVLLAELLTWCDKRVRYQAHSKPAFFDPKEMQQDGSKRYIVLQEVLRERGGVEAYDAFEQAWFSASLSECPTLTQWARMLKAPEPLSFVQKQQDPQFSRPDSAGAATMQVPAVRVADDAKQQAHSAGERRYEPVVVPHRGKQQSDRMPLWGVLLAGIVPVLVFVVLLVQCQGTSSNGQPQANGTATTHIAAVVDDEDAADGQEEPEETVATMQGNGAASTAEVETEVRLAVASAAAATMQAQQTAQVAITMTQEALSAMTATIQADSTATVQAQLDATAVTLAQQTSAIDAERSARSLLHLTGQFGNASSFYAPDLDSTLLFNGYEANIIAMRGLRGLRASQGSYTASVWARDLDYAMRGYPYVLGDMQVLQDSTRLFIDRVTADGVVPETIHFNWPPGADFENRQSWDAMPNLVHAVYAYVAKTGDTAFYVRHQATLLRVAQWIVRLDTNDDGLPDLDIFPYGYYDSIRNSVLHTYALAKCYATFRELAELERVSGLSDGTVWDERATRLRASFHRPVAEGGYWLAGQPWPVAARRTDGSVVPLLETFGVFEAVRSGLISSDDGEHYWQMMDALHMQLPALMAGPIPMKLALGGYEPDMLRTDPFVPQWMLDASAPWIVGLAAPVYAEAGYTQDAQTLLQAYEDMVRKTSPPVMEFAAEATARYGPGSSSDRGRSWDSAAWFMSVYGGHYGLRMTPSALIVEPHPFQPILGDGVQDFTYQGAVLNMSFDVDAQTYRIQADRATAVLLRPMGDAALVRVDDGPAQAEALLVLEPGREYVVKAVER